MCTATKRLVGNYLASPHHLSHVCSDVQQQANKGAKNHAVIMPDANPEATASALVGASMGAAGQRCMAISAAVFVGGIGKYKDALISKAKALKVTAGHEPGCDVGPVISRESKNRVEDLIHSATQQVGTLPIVHPDCDVVSLDLTTSFRVVLFLALQYYALLQRHVQ